MRPPDLPGGNVSRLLADYTVHVYASMRPPDLPGGNLASQECHPTTPPVLQ